MTEKRKKEKSLKPSLREKKRYLLLEAGKEEAEKAILDYIGILGYGKAGIMWVKENILAVNRNEIDNIKAGLLLAKIKVKRVSGTLKGLEK
jgi:RNase P/RNase MRP subunit POP5